MTRPYFSLKTLELETVAKTDPAGVLGELEFRKSRLAKKLNAILSGGKPVEEIAAPSVATLIAPAPKPSGINLAALRTKAERLKVQAEACHAERQTNTAKRLAQAMHKRLDGDRLKRQAEILDAVCQAIENGYTGAISALKTADVISKAQEASVFKCKNVCNGYHSYNVETREPHHSAPIHNELRGLLNPESTKAEALKSAQIQAEASLRQCDIPGFFPTPAAVIAVMLEQAGDLRGLTVLEPSAGKGDLMKAAFGCGATVRAFEIVPKLAEYIRDHVGCVQNADFLKQTPVADVDVVDVVLMNPPFEKDAAPKHVLQALKWLKPGGRLVAVMPANWSEKSAADPLHELDLLEIEVETGAFNGADAFRQTGVNTTIIVIKI